MTVAALTDRAVPLPRQLLALLRDPRRTFPVLIERNHPFEVMFFSAMSGVYVAYVGAERLHMGDRIGFVPTVLLFVACGIGLGLLALSLVDIVLTASSKAMGGSADREMFASVFGYATWPFIPLLIVLLPLEVLTYGDSLFSASRTTPTQLVPAVATVLELLTIMVWLYLMIEGTRVAGQLSEVQAAETVGLMFVRVLLIAVLAAVISVVSFLI